jgi:hypothetical protein
VMTMHIAPASAVMDTSTLNSATVMNADTGTPTPAIEGINF